MDDFVKPGVSFDKVIAALLDNVHPFPPVHLHRFSDLAVEDILKLKIVWVQINPDRRVALLEDLENLAEADTLVSFDDLSEFALTDPDPRAREVALRLLWESSRAGLAQKFLEMLVKDPDLNVQSAAATALGHYVYLGELEEIQQSLLRKIEERLLEVTTTEGNPKLLRRRALEAMGFTSRPEMKNLIRAAYNNGDREWLVTALFAMGRSADETWIPSVLEMLDSEDEDVLFESVRAAGELEAKGARKPILKIVKTFPEGSDIRMAGIWSLSKIGGEKVRKTLEALLELSEDDEEIGILEEAIENLEFTEGFNRFGLVDFDTKSEDELERMALFGEMISDDEDEDDDDDEVELMDRDDEREDE